MRRSFLRDNKPRNYRKRRTVSPDASGKTNARSNEFPAPPGNFAGREPVGSAR